MASLRSFALLLIAVLPVAAASSRPDFTGKWSLDIPRSNFGPNYPVPDKRTDTIDHRDPRLKIAVHEVGQGREVDGTVEYTTDGKECSNDVLGNPMKATVKWEGETLWIHTWGKFNEREIVLDDRWSLSDGGKTLTVNRHFEGPGGAKADQVLVFTKE